MILVIDNFDSFTYNLVAYFKELGQEVEVVNNLSTPESLDFNKYDGVVLSPGPSLPKDSGNLLTLIKEIKGKLPVLGICLGHQALGEASGAVLQRMNKPFHGKVTNIITKGDGLFNNLPEEFCVVRYHSWLIDDLSEEFNITAATVGNEIMAFENEPLKVDGIQFHPESILTEYGIDILRNWLIKRVMIP